MNNAAPHDGFFDVPQRQSAMGILVEAGYVAYRLLRAFWVFLLYLVIRPPDVPVFYIWLAVACVLLLLGIAGYLQFRHFFFHIDRERGEFVLQQGVLSKKRTAFQLDRIQQVNINQSLLQKITNVYGVEIETAGSSKSEASIRAVSYPVAQALRSRLLADSEGQTVPEAVPGANESRCRPFVNISVASLFKMGITSKYVESFFILLAFFFGIYNNIREVLQFDEDGSSRFDTFLASFAALRVALIVVVGLIILTVLFNLARTLVTYFGFSMKKTAKGISISYGLVNTRNILLYPQKVQMLVLVSNYFQRKMGLLWMTIRQASAQEQRNLNSNIQIPGSSVAESEAIMRFVLGCVPERGVALVPNYRKWLIESFVFIGIPVLAFLVAALVFGFRWDLFAGLLVYVVLAAALIRIGYRRARLYVRDDFIIQQYGIWDVRTLIIEPHKIQGITTVQYFWQRRANVGRVSIQTASGKLVFRYGQYDRIQAYVNRWMYQVESSEQPWM